MRFRGVRRLGALALSLFLLSGLPACSGQQQQEEGLEPTNEQGAENEAADEEGGQGNAAGADNQGGGEDNEGGENQASEGNEEGAEETAEGSGNATENDLQDIIQEMNGTGEGSNATANTPPLQQDVAAPVENATPANTAPVAEATPATPPAAESGGTPPPFQPGGTPAGKNLPESGSKMAYIVQKGDTLAKISSKIYGSNNRWNELAQLSGISNPSRIFPGDLVFYTLDESAVGFATAYEATQRSEAQVQAGDTLATIAKRVYGSSNAWRALWRENDKIDNPDIIPPGSTVFYVAQGAAAAAVSKAQSQVAKVAKVTNSVKSNVTTASTAAKQAVQSKVLKTKSTVATNAKSQVSKIKSSILLANSQLQYDAFDILNGYGKLAVFN